MNTLIRATAAAAFCACTSFASAAEFSPAQKQEMEQIIRSYLMEHPEIIEDMAKLLEQKQKMAQQQAAKEFLSANAKDVFRSPADLVLGNPKGSITVVEFFDYNCGWCKKGFPGVMGLLEKDKDLRLVLKEFPVLSDESVYAARAVIASGKQGKRQEMHLALLPFDGHVTREIVERTAKEHKLDLAKLTADMAAPETDSEILGNQQIAQSLGINGTPSFVIGDQLIPGFVPPEDLAATIEKVRQSGSCAKIC
jgi:protein-disulfide isomerase